MVNVGVGVGLLGVSESVGDGVGVDVGFCWDGVITIRT